MILPAYSFSFSSAVSLVGSIVLARASFLVLRFAWLHYLYDSNIEKYLHRTASNDSPAGWALVTGASDGIGKAFATQLAATGFNVVLHGRNKEKLDNVRLAILKSITGDKKVQIKIVIADATAPEDEVNTSISSIVSEMSSLPAPGLTVLVNNVGGSPTPRTPFSTLRDMSATSVDATFDLNVNFNVHLTRSLTPLLLANGAAGKKAGALILNMGSVAGEIGIPCLSVYSGTKAFVVAWSKALGRECAQIGAETKQAPIEVIAFIIGAVSDTSGMRTTPEKLVERIFYPSAATLVKAALGKVGYGRLVVPAYWGHALQLNFMGSDGWLSEGMITSALESSTKSYVKKAQ
jgi:17beta-estradiol 17-dehydrogenase / very-long-chain 3-oxoacyl-CoA reductase